MYASLTDEILNRVMNKTINLGNPSTATYCLGENGENIHFIFVVSKNMKTILKGLKRIMVEKNPKTVSWFSPDMSGFFIRRVLCHQLS